MGKSGKSGIAKEQNKMSDKRCVTCARFDPGESRCLRVVIAGKGLLVTRPDVGSCLYWKPKEVVERKEEHE